MNLRAIDYTLFNSNAQKGSLLGVEMNDLGSFKEGFIMYQIILYIFEQWKYVGSCYN